MGFKSGALIGLAVSMALASGCKCNRAAGRRAQPPRAVISLAWPGASVDDVEAMLAKPVESTLQALPGLTRLETRCAEGRLEVVAEGKGKGEPDSQFAWAQTVRTGLGGVATFLPQDAEAPVVVASAPPVAALVTLGADMPRDGLQALGQDVRRELERLPGVARVTVFGARSREVVVAVDPERLRAYGLSASSLAQALRLEALAPTGGNVATGDGVILVRTGAGRMSSVEDLVNTVVRATPDGTVIRLGDLATISSGYSDSPATEVLTPAGSGLLLAVHLRPGQVRAGIFKSLAGSIERLANRAPPGVLAMLQPLEGIHASGLVVGRMDLPAGTGLERSAELLAPLWRKDGLVGRAGPFVLLIGSAPVLAEFAPGGHAAVLVTSPQKPSSPGELSAQLRAWAASTPGLVADFRPLSELRRPGARLELLVCADEPGPLVGTIADGLGKRPELRVWARPGGARPELQVHVDRERAARLGVSAASVHQVVRLATVGEEILRSAQGGHDVGVRLKLEPAVDLVSDPSSLLRLRVPLPGGLAVGLGDVARVKQGFAHSQRLRVDGRRCEQVVIEPDRPWGGAEVKALAEQVRKDLPPGATVAARRL